MSNLINGKIPNQAIQTLKIVKDLFGSSIVGVYLFGFSSKWWFTH
ncbi:streptomycin 3''-adenylyltransferase domain protein [Staphylococcus aureus subsp. aureus CIG1176]|nr:streptomycin 3''-adenylyltransferase domain protein [Staphylococcus aureus subsp. aureus CIG1176]